MYSFIGSCIGLISFTCFNFSISLLARQSLKQISEVTFTSKGHPVVKIPVNNAIEYGH